METMHTIDSGASTGQEGGHMQGGVDRPHQPLPSLRQHLWFQHPVAAQGGISTTHELHLIRWDPLRRQCLSQRRHDLAVAYRRLGRRQRPGIGEKKQQPRALTQTTAQTVQVPAQQQWAAVQRLGAGGVVVDYHDGHGTIMACTALPSSLRHRPTSSSTAPTPRRSCSRSLVTGTGEGAPGCPAV